jgi:hypothetical protein
MLVTGARSNRSVAYKVLLLVMPLTCYIVRAVLGVLAFCDADFIAPGNHHLSFDGFGVPES